MTRSRRVPLPLAALGALLLLASAALWAPRPAAAALTAGSIRIVDRPASVRVIVHFHGGRLTGLANQVDAIDPDISDGRAVVRVNAPGHPHQRPRRRARRRGGADRPSRRAHRGAAGRAPGVGGAVQVRVLPDLGAAQRPGDRPVEGHPRRRRRAALSRRRLPADHATGAAESGRAISAQRPGAARRSSSTGWCMTLRLEARRGRDARADAAHRAARAPSSPDFSGYAVPGALERDPPRRCRVRRRTGRGRCWRRGRASAKDGSLECLVQVPVVVRP